MVEETMSGTARAGMAVSLELSLARALTDMKVPFYTSSSSATALIVFMI
jgi:hypothetical protein